ncbi:asparagine synthase (glutamine-hydrolyzing) [Candidatus Competibacter phosphatis]|uniref:asparagine synthase (glutamine-hydrolyzing) n=1 Tax=Candidatus Competibacter phosphatis TaxID=221280 RepID=A0ABX1TMJ6_9GAMM|nr:asparagine synthase (glutamine-hydrolyzing) [Candidatus Competibacter phosphatis]NMQ20638.1 asparagine synthase (glutamine-hydrolyzing) [Candidatus Competibacter phosphatis]
MCGIAGFLRPQAGAELEQVARRMADTLIHRGPNDSGVWTDSEMGIALGHRRLSILDLSPAGHQPMLSDCGRYGIAFNGEIYNHQELRRDLDQLFSPPALTPNPSPVSGRGEYPWRGHSDTETLLAGFTHWGVEETLRRTIGMFAIALWDRRDCTLTLARDRLGEKPLYYGWQGDAFLFGSELKALKAHPAFRANIDRGVLALFLRYNYVPAPYSIYEEIYKLPAGTYLQVTTKETLTPDPSPASGRGEPTTYWSLAEVAEHGMANPFAGSEEEALKVLEQHLGAAVRGQMVADVPLGALLSGGLDSTTITALMQANSSRPVRTFTIGFDEHEYDEATHACAVAAHLGTDHTELRLSGDDALALVPQMPAMYDEPFADASQLPTHLVMKLARQYVTVALSGDAGDELFGGYNRYVHVPKVWQRMGWLPGAMRSALGAGLTALPSDTINRLAGPLARRLGIAQPGDKAHKLGKRLHELRSMDDLYVSLVSEWPQVGSMVVGGDIPPNLLDERSRWPRLADPVVRMMALDGLTYLPDDILVKVDRAAMAVSLETRAPFLDRQVVEFAWSLPMCLKIRKGQGKWLLRRLLDRYVPRTLVERPKMGFGIPLDAWLRGPLWDWAESLLAEDRLRKEGYLDPAPIRAAWMAHLAGQASYGYRLWSVLMFQAWLEAN